MHLIACGDVAGFIAKPRQAALFVTQYLPRRNIFRALGHQRVAHDGIVGAGRSAVVPARGDQAVVQQIIAQHLVRQPAPPGRHRTQHDDFCADLLLQRRNGLGDMIEMLLPGAMQQHDVGPDLARQRQARGRCWRGSHWRTPGYARHRAPGMQELAVSCARPKSRLCCAWRRPGISAPAVESPQTSISGRRLRSVQSSANAVS